MWRAHPPNPSESPKVRRARATRSEPRGLAVVAPDVAERGADLAQCRLRARGVEHGRDHVVAAARSLHEPRQGAVDRRLVAHAAPLAEVADLVDLDLVRHAE